MESPGYSKIKALIKKQIDNNISVEETEMLRNLLADPKVKKTFTEVLSSQYDEFIEQEHKDDDILFNKIFNNIKLKIKHREKMESETRLMIRKNMVRRILIQGISLAAVFLLAFFITRKISFESGKQIADTGKDLINNVIRTPYGAITELQLLDGTHIMLNAGSSLKYNNGFNIQNRDIFLEGEAYFRVNQNSTLPFIVNASNISVKALGTEFNLKAYIDEGTIEATLIKGSIEIIKTGDGADEGEKILDLEPRQKAIYIKHSDQLTIDSLIDLDPSVYKPSYVNNDKVLISPEADIKQIIAWTNNELVIKSESLESLSVKLQRKYNVKIIFGDNNVKKYRFTGLLRDEPIEQVLNAIKLSAPIDFRVDGKTVLLISK